MIPILVHDRSIVAGRASDMTVLGRVGGSAAAGLGWLPALSLVSALGVFSLALADTAARDSQPHATALYWIAVVGIFAPIAVRLFRRDPTRPERLGLVVVLGLSFYLLKVMAWPLGFAFHDELGQLRTTADIAATHHLFSLNPIVPAYAYYPGIEEVTHAIAATSGLDPTVAGFVLVGAARLVLMIALFRFFELAGASSRIAGIAVLLYAANSNFVYFDAQVAYESLALPLVVLACLGVARSSKGDSIRSRYPVASIAVPAVCIAATVITHHVSAYFLAIVLVAWALLGHVRRLSGPPAGSWLLAAASVAATAGWYAFAGRATQRELGSIPAAALSSVWDLALGRSAPRELFHASSGAAEPQATQLIGFAAVVLVLVVLPFGVSRVLRRRNAVSIVLLVLAALYPPSLVLRLTAAGTETSSRASEFLFLGVAYVLAFALAGDRSRGLASRVGAWRERMAGSRVSRIMSTPAFGCYATVVFAGGLIIGWSPSARLPKPYQVGNPPRSIDPEGVESARWAARALPPGGTVIADSTNGLLLAAYGRQAPTGSLVDGVPLLALYRSRSLDAADRAVLGSARYLVTDRRLTTALPLNGGYFGPDGYTLGLRRPLPLAGLRKFEHVPGLDRIYDSGNIAIYGTGGG